MMPGLCRLCGGLCGAVGCEGERGESFKSGDMAKKQLMMPGLCRLCGGLCGAVGCEGERGESFKSGDMAKNS